MYSNPIDSVLDTLTVGSNYMDKYLGNGGYLTWLENLGKDVKSNPLRAFKNHGNAKSRISIEK